MKSLMELNGGVHRSFLDGKEETSRFKAGQYIELHNSTMCKAYFFRDVFSRASRNRLRTKTNSWRYRINEISTNPIVQIIGIIGILGGLLTLIIEIIK
jgi:hypothetical protein